MKKNFSLLMLVGFLATQAYAAPITRHKLKAPKATLEQQLAKYVTYPDALKLTQQAGIVVIQFRVNAADQLCQLEVFSQNEQLNNTLLRQLTGKKLTGYGSDLGESTGTPERPGKSTAPADRPGELHTVRLHFQPE